jgi:hypothetical protein
MSFVSGKALHVVFAEVQLWKHALVQDAKDENIIPVAPVENHVLALFATAQPGTNLVACAAEHRMIGDPLATLLQLIEVTGTLLVAPHSARVVRDVQQVGFGAPCEAETGHVYLALRKAES